MKYPRYRVATCEGWTISGSAPGRAHGTQDAGLSATVCDTFYNWREVRTYRSEDRGYFDGALGRRGKERALRDAEDHAAYLNAIHRRALHTEAVRTGRAEARARG